MVFDAYGTLLKVNSDLSDVSPTQKKQSEDIQKLWRSKQLEYTWLSSLMGKFEGFNKVTNDALTYAFNYYGIDNEHLKQSILAIFEKPVAFFDAKTFLEACKNQNIETAILSNGEPDMLKRSVSNAGIEQEIDHILSASQVGVFKPSPKVYQLATLQFRCKPEAITFFSSNPWDIAGAAHFGFKTIWINRNELPFEELGVQPHMVCGKFEDLNPIDLLAPN